MIPSKLVSALIFPPAEISEPFFAGKGAVIVAFASLVVEGMLVDYLNWCVLRL